MAKKAKIETYTLMDGIEINQQHPETFQIPDAGMIQSLQVGHWVKLGFEQPKMITERMWVHITKIEGDNFEGTLDNDPLELTAVKHNDIVSFQTRHILTVM